MRLLNKFMPRIKSAKKALRNSLRKRERNLERKKALKASVKSFKKTTKGGKEAEAALSQAFKRIDKAAKVGLIKKNKASRMKSALAKSVK